MILYVKYVKHLIVVMTHKYFVMIECFKRGLYVQGIVHDLSKFNPSEFIQSAEYFQGTGTPIAKIKECLGYSSAWLHHKGRNKHHWEYWIDFYDGEMKPCDIPEKFLIEIACDMIGASHAYLGKSFTHGAPLAFFHANSINWVMLRDNVDYIERVLSDEATRGDADE